MQTSISVKGANCPTCFNETLEELARLDGVQSVRGSFAGPCIEIEHSDDATDAINTSILTHLHGTQMFADEMQMVELTPTLIPSVCQHGQIN